MSKTIIAVRHFGLGGRESLETAVIQQYWYSRDNNIEIIDHQKTSLIIWFHNIIQHMSSIFLPARQLNSTKVLSEYSTLRIGS